MHNTFLKNALSSWKASYAQDEHLVNKKAAKWAEQS